ncbi:unnamed protein product [Soboliphyme baturini]|uniref:PGM_PMM_IV domain-containing protein n=1 Tax=Soboliphyme baturini TaxID=241478 RepID=A0A183J8B9_9BILA|nr:unnamed protein product [Soboliphyme baturini]
MMDDMMSRISKGELQGQSFEENGKVLKIAYADSFTYKDPIDSSVSANQGIRLIFDDCSRIVFRLSGTGSSGATIRMYIDSYEGDIARHAISAQELLQPLIRIALRISKLQENTGRDKPTVIT